jgi:diaminopimelate decarboxylase
MTTGAYATVLGSNYNSRLKPAEIMLTGKQLRQIRRRETYSDLVRLEG